MAKQAADHFTLDLLDKPKRGRPRKPDAMTPAQRARDYRERLRTGSVVRPVAPVAVLFARSDSVYKTFHGCDVYDFQRDALTWPGGTPAVMHPPCRSWGSLAHFAKPRPGEKQLALWAVEQVRKNGGVIEHPAKSRLWAAANLPLPGEDPDEFGGWTLPISQYWWGHRAEKKTYLYIVGCDTPPPMPIRAGRATHVIASGCRNDDGSRVVKGDPKWRPKLSEAEREHTPHALAAWLVELARRCKR